VWQRFNNLVTGRVYWLCLALLGLAMEAIALYFQYALGDEPCQVCIHVRIWVAAFTLLAMVMCVLPPRLPIRFAGHLFAVFCFLGLLERSWYLYALENGIGEGSCQFFLGFPDWFALDRWFPSLFEVRNLCGFTPEILPGITMAEALVLESLLLLVLSSYAFFLAISGAHRR